MRKGIFVLITAMFVFALCMGANAEVKFLGKDITTKGDWPGKYGANGVILFAIKDQTDMKDITKFDDAKNTRWDWANPTDDKRGLVMLTDKTKRIGSCMYNNPTSVITLTTSLTSYQVTLCVLDWDSTARSEELVGFQGATIPAKADATVTNPEFNAGVYYKWAVTGSDPFKIQVTFKAGANWVMSGLFLDQTATSAVQPGGKLATTWGDVRTTH